MDHQKKGGLLSCFLPYTRGLRGTYLLAVMTTFLGILFNFLAPQVIRVTVDSVIGNEPFALPDLLSNMLTAIGGREMLRSSLYICAGAILLCTALEGLFVLSSRLLMSHATESFVKRLRDSIFRHIQHLPFSWHTGNRTGDIIQRCSADMDVIRNFIANQMLEVVRIVMLAVTAVVLMASMNGTLTLIAVAFIPVVAGYSGIFFSKISGKYRVADEADSDLMVDVQENLTGVRVVRAFGREKQELEKFDHYNDRQYSVWVDMGYILGAYWGLGDLVTGVQVMTIIAAGAYMAYTGSLTLGEFLVFVSYNRTLAWPLRRLGRILSDLSKTRVSAIRLAEIYNAPEEEDAPDPVSPVINGSVSFKNVSFGYDGAEVLNDVSFDIPAGSTFGILGNTGSGKSTLCYLLDRLYDLAPGCGSITIDGTDIKDMPREYLRSNVGLVLQEPFLFSRTIAENIAIARPEAGMDQIRRAASIADIDKNITEFPSGYDTLVGERGVTLSGGQKQRVAIARTLMCRCPIMVFDDSLSAVDLTTDAHIRAALKKETGGATVILISHRINTLMDCDKIMVLENGRVAETGTHRELLEKDGIYRHTYDLQSAAARASEDRI